MEKINYKMGKEKLRFGIFYDKEKLAQVNQEIYQKRESSYSTRDFGSKRARKVNKSTLRKISKKI